MQLRDYIWLLVKLSIVNIVLFLLLLFFFLPFFANPCVIMSLATWTAESLSTLNCSGHCVGGFFFKILLLFESRREWKMSCDALDVMWNVMHDYLLIWTIKIFFLCCWYCTCMSQCEHILTSTLDLEVIGKLTSAEPKCNFYLFCFLKDKNVNPTYCTYSYGKHQETTWHLNR